jgi:hypothetical protein
LDHPTTRRNPKELVDVINSVFINSCLNKIPDYKFVQQDSLWQNPLPDKIIPKVIRLPLISIQKTPNNPENRDPLEAQLSR